jgi:hypothetical protein
MGSFSYLCNGCVTGLRQDEQVVLKHLRHGQVLGETQGHYDDCGRVTEDPVFRDDDRDAAALYQSPVLGSAEFNPNSHMEMCASDFEFPDSGGDEEYANRIYQDQSLSKEGYARLKIAEGVVVDPNWALLSVGEKHPYITLPEAEHEAWWKLPTDRRNVHSGIEAWHLVCYRRADQLTRDAHLISPQDPEQGSGEPRPEYL